jgi:parvulin-like peptidyl-prolyl isomerase
MFEGEDRQQAVVTVLFVLAILAVILILLGSIALTWYNDNLRPLARVGSTEVGPQLLRQHVELQQWRLELQGNRLQQANVAGEIDLDTYTRLQSELEQQSQDLATNALTNLIDLLYQSQLAPGEGVAVTDADVDARVADSFAGVERRHILAIVVEPVSAEDSESATPTLAERRQALERAQAALAAVQSGQDWATVAREYSTDDSAATGGDLGVISEVAVPDTTWGDELFELQLNGTTGVVRGSDGAYRIGRVTEIQVAAEQPGLREQLTSDVPESSLRELLRHELAAQRLRDRITAAALAETSEQARISLIYIEGLDTGDPIEDQGQIDYSEIVYAPNDDLEVAPDLPEDDPAWATAQQEAQAAFDQLNAVPVGDEREARFAATATAVSDSPTKEDGGAVGFVSRSIPPTAVGDALFDTTRNPGDLIGPIRGDAAYYVLLFNERRGSPAQRVQQVRDLLAQPDADFAAIAKEWSEGPEAEDGGEVGWLTKDQLSAELRERVFALAPGQIGDPIEFQGGHYIVKMEEKGPRAADPDQVPDVEAAAFDDWYTPKKTQAIADGQIVIPGQSGAESSLDPGVDQP